MTSSEQKMSTRCSRDFCQQGLGVYLACDAKIAVGVQAKQLLQNIVRYTDPVNQDAYMPMPVWLERRSAYDRGRCTVLLLLLVLLW